jgi:hypothetical protein
MISELPSFSTHLQRRQTPRMFSGMQLPQFRTSCGQAKGSTAPAVHSPADGPAGARTDGQPAIAVTPTPEGIMPGRYKKANKSMTGAFNLGSSPQIYFRRNKCINVTP